MLSMEKFLALWALLICSTFVHAQDWTLLSSLPVDAAGRNHPVSFSIDGKGYVGLGQDDDYSSLADIYRYDPETDSWQSRPDFEGGARSYAYAVTKGIKAYIGFGSADFGQAKNDLWEYDAGTGLSTELTSLPGPGRNHPAMVESNGKIYVGLGDNDSGDLKDWWAYDIADDSWEELPDFPGTPRHHPYFFAIDGLVYVGFGHGEDIYKDFYRYDPASEEWTQLEDLPAEGRVAGTQFSFEGKGYILSGQGESHGNLIFGEFWQYDPNSDSWEELEAHPGTGRWAPGSFIIENMLYFTSGEAQSNEKDLWAYELAALEPVSLASTVASGDVVLSPNPSQGLLRIESREQIHSLTIFRLDGKMEHQISSPPSELTLDICPGLYIVQLLANSGTIRQKLSLVK